MAIAYQLHIVQLSLEKFDKAVAPRFIDRFETNNRLFYVRDFLPPNHFYDGQLSYKELDRFILFPFPLA